MNNYWAVRLQRTQIEVVLKDNNQQALETSFQPTVLFPSREACFDAIERNNSMYFKIDSVISSVNEHVETYRLVDKTNGSEEIAFIYPLAPFIYNEEKSNEYIE